MPLTKEDILDSFMYQISTRKENYEAILKAMDDYAKPYKEIAELISSIFFYGNFNAETHNEVKLEQKLREVGLWPTTEDEIIQRSDNQLIEQQNKDNDK